MILKIFFCSILYVILLGINSGVESVQDHKRLLNNLFKDYDINERPVQNENDTVHVKFGIKVMNLIDVNIAQGYLETNLFLSMEWNDMYLKWEPSEYGDIKTLFISPNKIWKPDILLYNSVHPEFDGTYPYTNVIIKYDGNIIYVPPGIFRSPCPTDVTNYPFDEHNCSLKFGSWTLDGGNLNLKLNNENGNAENYVKNFEWVVLGVPGTVNTMYYACCPNPYMDIGFTIQLKRNGNAIFNGCSLVLFFGTVSILLCLFLPINSIQRINLGIVCLLSLLWMEISIHNNLGGKYSILVCYFRTLKFMTFISIIINVFILYFYNRNPSLHKIPYFIWRIFCEQIPNFILLNPPTKNISFRVESISIDSGNISNQIDSHEQYDELVTDLQVLVQHFSGRSNNTRRGGEEQDDKTTNNNWKYLAIVIDRLALIIYSIFTLIFLLAFYCQFS